MKARTEPGGDLNEHQHPRIEREKTDECLRRERNNTDRTLVGKRRFIEDLADEMIERARGRANDVVERARERADKILAGEREKANEKLAPLAAAAELIAIAQDRVREDGIVRQERLDENELVHWEREELSRALAALLPLVREETNRFLLNERVFSDESIAHRDDFMSMVSHDLRNELAGIAMHAKLVELQVSYTDEGRETLARIDRCVARMKRMIGDLVDVGSIERGKLDVDPKPGNAAELIAEVILPFAQAAKEKRISLVCNTSGQVLPAVFDNLRMFEVLTNLIANAMRFTPSGGTITLEAAQAGHDLRISVLDTGVGIAEDEREAIFDRFRQIRGNAHGGLGLGLYITRYIVEAHGGRIWVETNPTGHGSAFHITIPATGGANV